MSPARDIAPCNYEPSPCRAFVAVRLLLNEWRPLRRLCVSFGQFEISSDRHPPATTGRGECQLEKVLISPWT
jgi:hypothetical protein